MIEVQFTPSLRAGAEDSRFNREQVLTVMLTPTVKEADAGPGSGGEVGFSEATLTRGEENETVTVAVDVPDQEGICLLSIYHISGLLPGGQTEWAFQGFVTLEEGSEHDTFVPDTAWDRAMQGQGR